MIHRKTSPDRQYIRYSTSELKDLAKESLSRPQRLAAVYFELQFRERKAARELRDYVRFLLASFGHPFRWPSTTAQPGQEALADGVFEIDIGVLRTLGYRVGVEGLGEIRRHDLLDDVYTEPLGILRGHPQEAQWGGPASARRLHKLANVIAAFARNAKRRARPPAIAVAEWEADLRYLKKKFYDGRYDFQWPRTEA
jgi:hypothetical protein